MATHTDAIIDEAIDIIVSVMEQKQCAAS